MKIVPVVLLYTTLPNRKAAERISRMVLQKRLAGCVMALPAMSRYWWRGKIERAREVVLLIKTTPQKKSVLKRFLAEHHPYDVPVIAEIRVTSVNAAYRKWLRQACQ